jgi:hypothetical protein
MTPLVYVAIGLIGGGFIVAIIALLLRRGKRAIGMEAELVIAACAMNFRAIARKQARPRRISAKN